MCAGIYTSSSKTTPRKINLPRLNKQIFMGNPPGLVKKTCLDNVSVEIALPHQTSLPQTTIRRADVLKISS